MLFGTNGCRPDLLIEPTGKLHTVRPWLHSPVRPEVVEARTASVQDLQRHGEARHSPGELRRKRRGTAGFRAQPTLADLVIGVTNRGVRFTPRLWSGRSTHSGKPACRSPSSNLLRSSGLRSGIQSLTVETRLVGSSWRKRAMTFCASGSRPASALAAAKSRMDA